MKYLLVGNYGVGNFGDEALKQYFQTRYDSIEWITLSANPTKAEYNRLPLGVRSFFRRWPTTLKAYWQADGIVFGGGTLFTDIESLKACFLWSMHALPAFVLRKKVMLAFQGIGPFRTRTGEWLTKKVCQHADYISVRDSQSYTRVTPWKTKAEVIKTVDPVVLLINKHQEAQDSNCLGLIPRHNSSADFMETAKEMSQKQHWNDVRIISFQPHHESEKKCIQQLLTLIPTASVHEVSVLDEAIAAIEDCSWVLSHRFHGSIISLCLEKKLTVSTQQSGDKHSGVLETYKNIEAAKQTATTAETLLKDALKKK